MSFQTWSELNPDAKNELVPNLGQVSWNDLSPDDKNVIWQHLFEQYFFNKTPTQNNDFLPGYDIDQSIHEFYGHPTEQRLKFGRIMYVIKKMNANFKKNNYAKNYLKSPGQYTACLDFYSIYSKESENVVLELFSLYAQAIINEKHDFDINFFDLFAKDLNDVFSHFSQKYYLTKLGFIPRVEEKIITEIYTPVLQSLANPQWKEVNTYLAESFSEYRKNTPEGYGTCVTKAVTAVQAFLQILVYGKTGSGEISKLILEAQKKDLIPKDSFTSQIFKDIESALMRQRQDTGDPHPRKEFATAKNSMLVLNLAMVFFHHCIV
jgi:hypothetical protein